MRELPILFSTPMVKSIQKGIKNQTRRTAGLEKVNEDPDEYYFQSLVLHAIGEFTFAPVHPNGTPLKDRIITCIPRFIKGDHIWVRESYYASGYWISDGLTKTGKIRRTFIDNTLNVANQTYLYEDTKPEKFETSKNFKRGAWFKRTSLFMPKKAARTWLECTGVRCERLYDISEENAINEGVSSIRRTNICYYNYLLKDHMCLSSRSSFFSLWTKINGEESLKSNPWVFIYDFKIFERNKSVMNILDEFNDNDISHNKIEELKAAVSNCYQDNKKEKDIYL